MKTIATKRPDNWPWPSTVQGIRKSRVNWDRVRDDRLVGEVAAATQFRLDAEADGWSFDPTYPTNEPVEHAFRGTREGFIIQGLARPGKVDLLPTGDIHAWGPDGISLTPMPIKYPGFDVFKALTRHCPECGANDVDTVRVAFANRCCRDCAPALKAKLEKPGWCD
jgi:hypothetical protein